MEQNNKLDDLTIVVIIALLVAILFVLFDIRGTLKEIYSDTHYTSASADYLENIQNILTDIRNQR
jgi:hypothetical protein